MKKNKIEEGAEYRNNTIHYEFMKERGINYEDLLKFFCVKMIMGLVK